MLDQDTLTRVLRMGPALGCRDRGCFGCLDPARREYDTAYHPQLRTKNSTGVRGVKVIYESFTDPVTGETLYRPV